MFHVGDKVVHPLHGAGVIEGMVERTIDDTPAWYYVLRPAFGDTELFLPVDGCGRLGIRPVCSRERAERFLDGLDTITCSESKSWNQRYRENMQRIKSGDLTELAAVIKALTQRDEKRPLSTGERRMLNQARQILLSEISLSVNCPYDFAEAQLDQCLRKPNKRSVLNR